MRCEFTPAWASSAAPPIGVMNALVQSGRIILPPDKVFEKLHTLSVAELYRQFVADGGKLVQYEL